MAEALVSAILEQLASIIHQQTEEGVRLLLGVDEEVEMLRSNFLAIQAVLNDAEKKQGKDNAVNLWVDKLKNTSYDIEDVLDEWNTMIGRLQVKEVEDASMPLRKVCSLVLYYLCCCRRVVLHCDTAVKIKNLNRTLDVISKEKDRFKFSLSEGIENPERQMTTSAIDLSEVCGRDQEKDSLISLLLSESSQGPILPIISIVGVGGIGKTTLAQLAFNDDKVEAHFDKKIWVCVSNPFHEKRIAKAILESLQDVAPNLDELETLLRKIRQSLEGKKFLLILDDVWIENPNKWEKLKHTLNCGSKGSRIVVTTRKLNTARVMETTNPNMILIGTLSNQESWSLFSKIAFFDGPREELERLEYIGGEIVGKCKGLPLAIKTLGSLLRFKDKIEEWERVLGSELWELEEVEEGLFPPLMLSYYDLPFQLRKCFSYCVIFPKDHVMEKDTLIKLWMAQGYLTEGRNKDMNLIGEEYFKKLAMRSFFQDFEKNEFDGSIIKCKMHDIVHDFAQFLTKNECFTIEGTSHAEPQICSFYKNVRHLMVKKEVGYPLPIHNKKLRTLLIDNSDAVDISQFFEKLTCLRTLSLSGGYLIGEIPKGIKNLVHLRYLKLGNYAPIRELPEIVCDLYNLQTLDLTGTCIMKLPQGIGKLVNLRHLLIDETPYLKYMPKGLERLTALKPLSKFVIAGSHHGNKAFTSLEFLKNWNYGRGNFALKGLGNVSDVSAVNAADFKRKKNLFDLTLSFDYELERKKSTIEENELILQELQPPPNLVKLSIEDYPAKTMSLHWMGSLTNLRELKLQGFFNLEYLPPLGKLRSLESLYLWWMKSIKRVSDEFLGIKNDTTSPSSIISFGIWMNWKNGILR